ncbi:MAG: acetate kinase [Eubacteriales bacterium]|nr:acetate kinase [Eubacteriales bacterium]
MLILSCNVGSTSLKYRLYDMAAGEKELASGHFEGVGRKTGAFKQQTAEGIREAGNAPPVSYADAINQLMRFLLETGTLPEGKCPACVAFKVVAALGYSGVQQLDEAVLGSMAAINSLLPAHNPPYITAVRLFARRMPGTPMIGSFETGFFQDMPEYAAIYPLPRNLFEQGVRRNGAHGASHEFVSRWIMQKEGREDLKIITCHLGGSSSLAAVKDGKGVDTTIGMSLQTGLPHNNRIGDIDPYLTFYLNESLGMGLEEIKALYSQESGLKGLSGGLSDDFREIQQAAWGGNPAAKTAVEAFAYQIKKQIGAYAAALGGLDAIAFAGGIGQNNPALRAAAIEGLEFLGIKIDPEKNGNAAPGSLISAEGSPVRVYVVATNEEIVIARKALAFLTV